MGEGAMNRRFPLHRPMPASRRALIYPAAPFARPI